MGKARTKVEDSRKPKHSRDASRPSKGGKGQRDAATVRSIHPICFEFACLSGRLAYILQAFLKSILYMQVRRLKMYSKTAKRDKTGKIIHQVRLWVLALPATTTCRQTLQLVHSSPAKPCRICNPKTCQTPGSSQTGGGLATLESLGRSSWTSSEKR